MIWVLGILFLVVPIVELFLAIQVADIIGGWYTVASLVIVSIVGAWLVRREGSGLWRKVQEQLRAGKLPTDPLVDGLLVLVAATLMLTPGYLTDATGMALLIPFTRIPIRKMLIRRYRHKIAQGDFGVSMGSFGLGGFGTGGVNADLRSDTGPNFSGPGFGRRGRKVYDVDGEEVGDIEDDYPELPPRN